MSLAGNYNSSGVICSALHGIVPQPDRLSAGVLERTLIVGAERAGFHPG